MAQDKDYDKTDIENARKVSLDMSEKLQPGFCIKIKNFQHFMTASLIEKALRPK